MSGLGTWASSTEVLAAELGLPGPPGQRPAWGRWAAPLHSGARSSDQIANVFFLVIVG